MGKNVKLGQSCRPILIVTGKKRFITNIRFPDIVQLQISDWLSVNVLIQPGHLEGEKKLN